MNHPTHDPELQRVDGALDEHLSASQLTGAEAMFLDVLEAVLRAQDGGASPGPQGSDAGRLLHVFLPFRAEFRRKYAALLERHLGAARANAALLAFRSAPLQRYVMARRAMVPELTVGLQHLVQRMSGTGL